MTMAEPDVALTDYALAIESAILAWLLVRGRSARGGPRAWSVLFFGAIGLAALAGGTDHGFAADPSSGLHAFLRMATYACIGVAALAAWWMGTAQLSAAALRRGIKTLAVSLLAVYLLAIPGVDSFLLPVAYYLPAALFLLMSYGMAYRRGGRRGYLWGAIGLLLTFLAAAVQQAEIALHERWFDHNALYHLIQGIALALVYLGAREAIRQTAETR